MDSNKMLKDYLNWLFNELNCKNIRYCVLRNYENLPEYVRSDVDFLINKKQLKDCMKILKDMKDVFTIDYIHLIKHQYGKIFILYKFTSNKKLFRLIIDFSFNFEWYGAKFLKADEILRYRNRYKNFYIPDKIHEAIMCWLKPLIYMGIVKSKYARKAFIISQENSNEFKKCMRKILGKSLSLKLWKFINENNFSETVKFRKRIKRIAWFKAFFHNPFDVIYNLIKHIFIEIRKRIITPEKAIAFIGPDGSGKSTVINNFTEYFDKFCLRESKIFHFRPSLIPSLNVLLKGNRNSLPPEDFTNPHRAPPSGFLLSIVRILYYTIDYILGYLIKVKPLLAKYHKVIFDRYYYTFIVDPHRSRINLPTSLLKFFMKFIPKPHAVIYLDNKPEILLKRKQELPLKELKRQIKEYRNLVMELPNGYVINGDRQIDDIVHDVIVIALNIKAIDLKYELSRIQ